MESFDRLDTIAEVAITLAGFSGLVMAFSSRGALDVEGLRRIVYIVAMSFVVAFTALIPTGLIAFGLSISEGIRTSSLILAVATLAFALNGIMSWIRGKVAPAFPKVTVLTLSSAGLSGLLLLCGVLNVWLSTSVELLILGQIVLLSVAAWAFLSSIVWISRRDNENDA